MHKRTYGRCGGGRSLLGGPGLLRVALLEAIDATGGVDELLLAGEERMALRADLDAELLLGRARRPGFTASAVDLNLLILRMDFCFHDGVTTPSIFEKFS